MSLSLESGSLITESTSQSTDQPGPPVSKCFELQAAVESLSRKMGDTRVELQEALQRWLLCLQSTGEEPQGRPRFNAARMRLRLNSVAVTVDRFLSEMESQTTDEHSI